jgi:lipoate---protein ligase
VVGLTVIFKRYYVLRQDVSMPDTVSQKMNVVDRVTTWRLIPPIDATGTVQMAIDSWLLQQHILGQIPPTLRFYTWSEPTISLGYHQRRYPEHWDGLRWQDLPVAVIKRPTGGRGVLHDGDLTYALVGSGFVGKRVEVYQQVCQFLIDGWRGLGVDLVYGTAGSGYIHNPNCFGTATAADLVMADGAKFIGSAQLHKDGAILQHGSMRLAQDADLFEQVFGERSPMPQLPQHLTQPAIMQTLTDAAADCFDAEFAIAPLTQEERAQIGI